MSHEAHSDPGALLRMIREDAALREEDNFAGRQLALDSLEEIRMHGPPSLRDEAGIVMESLEALDAALFVRLRSELRRASSPGDVFRAMLKRLFPARGPAEGPGYDALDAFLNGLLHPDGLPGETRPLDPGMVPFQKTPGRIVLEMIEKARFGPGDLFLDVGSGLGQIPLLAHLLAGVRAAGLEWEPAYVAEARARAADLGLAGVEFLAGDARSADYAPATVLFLFTPCTGAMLDEVLERMRIRCRSAARVFTYGPCTRAFARQSWLSPIGLIPRDGNALASFTVQ